MVEICAHVPMTIQRYVGPVTPALVGWHEWVKFHCVDCNLDCYRQRSLGRMYNSNWETWIPKDQSNELQPIGTAQPIPGQQALCFHAFKTTTSKCESFFVADAVQPVAVQPGAKEAEQKTKELLVESMKIGDLKKAKPTGNMQMKEVATFSCQDCNMKCTRQRVAAPGSLASTPWAK